MALHEAGSQLRRIAAGVDKHGYLEWVARERSGPGGGALARDRKTVARATESVRTCDEAMVRGGDAFRELDQAQYVSRVDAAVGATLRDALRQRCQVDARARDRLQLCRHGIEIFDGQRSCERLLDEHGHLGSRFLEAFCEPLRNRLLVELSGRQSKPDGDLLAGTGLGRITTRHRKLAVARQQHGRRRTHVGVFRGTIDRCGGRVGRRGKRLPGIARLGQTRRILCERRQRARFAGADADVAGFAGIRVDGN